MCFSTTASFVSGGLIVASGSYFLYQQTPFDKRSILGLIPVLFRLQQISEGMVWASIHNNGPPILQIFFGYIFSFMATSLWPAFMPFAAYHFETSKRAKLFILPFLATGLLISVYLFWSSVFYSTLQIEVKCNQMDCNSLAYLFELPISGNWINYIYLVCVIAPLAICTDTKVRFLVMPAFLFSFVLGALISKSQTFPSVWCFFAAAMSISIFFTNKNYLKEKT